MRTEEDIIQIIYKDDYMMEILQTARKLQLPDWWICAGFLRAKIWDVLHEVSVPTQLPDVDVIYFDKTNINEDVEKKWENDLRSRMPQVPWSVKNQARMHTINQVSPYLSSEDAISKFPETATALGVKLTSKGELLLTAPWGIDDAVNMAVRPTPYFNETKTRLEIYKERQRRKNWQATWSSVTIEI